MKLLDTTFLIHYWGGVDAVGEYLQAHENEEFVTTTLNLKEIAVGRARQGALDRAEIDATFGWVRVIPFDRPHAFIAGELESALHEDPDVNRDEINSLMADLLIAAVASEQEATVVTENTADFEYFDGVTAESYR